MERNLVDLTYKKIESIEPFNDFFYHSCFYSALFPIVKYFGKPIWALVINGVIGYKFYNGNGQCGLYSHYNYIESVENCLSKQGIKMKCEVKVEDVVSKTIEELKNDEPVMVSIDCFYESIREDCFQKQHLPHTLLVIGYDFEMNTFHVIEQNHVEDVILNERILLMEDLRSAYEGFLNYFHDGISSTYVTFQTDLESESENEKESIYQYYLQNYSKTMPAIKKGIEDLKQFKKSIGSFIEKREMLETYGLDILTGVNDIIKSKNVQEILHHHLFGEHSEIFSNSISITEKWKKIRIHHGKFIFSGVFKETFFEKILNLLEEIIVLEIYNDELITKMINEEKIYGKTV